MRKPSTFTQSDVNKAVKGVTSAGVEVTRVEIEPSGKIIITTTATGEPAATNETPEDVKKLL